MNEDEIKNMWQAIEKEECAGALGSYYLEYRPVSQEFTQITPYSNPLSVWSPTSRRSNVNLIINKQFFEIPEESAFGNLVILNSRVVKEVRIRTGAQDYDHLYADFVDFSKPLPLFTSLYDFLEGTEAHRNTWVTLKHHNLEIEFITYEPFTKVDWTADIFAETNTILSKEYQVILHSYLQITAGDSGDMQVYPLYLEFPTVELSVIFYPRDETVRVTEVTLQLLIGTETIHLSMVESGGKWCYKFPATEGVPYSYQFPNLYKISSTLLVTGTSYKGMNVEQKYLNILRSYGGIANLAFSRPHFTTL